MTTFVCKFKCLSCSLHFVAYTWTKDWNPGWCPECGTSDRFIRWLEATDLQIYELVPGMTPIDSWGPVQESE